MRIISLMIGLLLLSGCGGRAIDAPGLGPRAVERLPIPLPDEASEPQVATDPALAARIEAVEATAREGQAEFERLRGQTAMAVARAQGAPAGGESWTVAQQQLSALDAARGAIARAAADIDALHQEPANASSGNRAAIEAAAARIEALSQAEAEAFAALSGRLKS